MKSYTALLDSCLVTFAFIDLAENLQYNIQD